MPEIENAQIHEVNLGFEDHGIFGINIALRGGSWSQGTGWFDVRRIELATMLCDLLTTVGVNELKDLPGKFVRIRREDGRIVAIGNLLAEKQWWAPQDYFGDKG